MLYFRNVFTSHFLSLAINYIIFTFCCFCCDCNVWKSHIFSCSTTEVTHLNTKGHNDQLSASYMQGRCIIEPQSQAKHQNFLNLVKPPTCYYFVYFNFAFMQQFHDSLYLVGAVTIYIVYQLIIVISCIKHFEFLDHHHSLYLASSPGKEQKSGFVFSAQFFSLKVKQKGRSCLYGV